MQKVESNLLPMLPRKDVVSDSLKPSEEKEEINIQDLLIDVSLPQVIPEYVTEKMLVMTYIDGFKVSQNLKRMRASKRELERASERERER